MSRRCLKSPSVMEFHAIVFSLCLKNTVSSLVPFMALQILCRVYFTQPVLNFCWSNAHKKCKQNGNVLQLMVVTLCMHGPATTETLLLRPTDMCARFVVSAQLHAHLAV